MTFVIYTTETGGIFKVSKASEDTYRAAVESGKWVDFGISPEIRAATVPLDLKFIALLRVEQNHDFVLGRSRDDLIAA